MTIDKERLRVLAEAATPGPWESSAEIVENEGGPLFVTNLARGGKRSIICRIENRVSQRPLDSEDYANARLMAAARDAIPALLSENAALAAEVERLRSTLKTTTAVAITMLFETHEADVTQTFSIEELENIVKVTEPLRLEGVQTESIYRAAWDAAMADKGGVSES